MKHAPVRRLLIQMRLARSGAQPPLTPSRRHSAACDSTEHEQIGSAWNRPFLPMHLPVKPLYLSAPGSLLKGRRLQRHRRRLAAWDWTEWLVAYFNYFELWSPKQATKSSLGPYALSGEQALAFASLFDKVLAFLRPGPSLEVAPGRGIAHVVEILKTISLDTNMFSTFENRKWEAVAASTAALPVTKQDVLDTTPTLAGNLLPENILLGSRSEQFLDTEDRLLDPQPLSEDIPKGCFLVDDRDEAELRDFLLERKLVQIVPVPQVPHDSAGNPIVGSLFGVHHKRGKRLIFDRRPQNSIEKRLGWATLPLGSQFCRLIVRPDEDVRGSGSDLKSAFFQCRNAPGSAPRNAVGNPFDGEGYEEHGAIGGQKYYIGFVVLGMGDHNSVDIVQALHTDLFVGNQAVGDNGFLAYGDVFPQQGVIQGIYIDDLILAHVCASKTARLPVGPDVDLAKKCLRTYSEHNVELSHDKGFGFLAGKEGLHTFDAWGTRVRSRPGDVSTPIEKRRALSCVLLYVVLLGAVPKPVLESLLGLVVHPFMHRRCLMSAFHRVYKHMSMFGDFDIVTLTCDIKMELVLAALLLPCAYTNIRAPVDTVVSTTDATPMRGGATAVVVSNELCEKLYGASPDKGWHARLDQDPEWHPGVCVESDKVVEEMVDCLPWRETRNHDFAKTSHINLQEKRETSNELRVRVTASVLPKRYVNLADSLVHVGSSNHGRSSSFQLNGLMRRDLGWRVLGQKDEIALYLNTKHNPSDDPSRNACLREPLPPADWMTDLFAPGIPVGIPNSVPKARRLCKEVFSGCSHLSVHLGKCGLNVGKPFEAYPSKGVYIHACDVLDPITLTNLVSDIKAGVYFYMHFGIPCKSWGPAARLNKCTRSGDCPGGDGSLERELLGNRLADVVGQLCQLLIDNGGYYSIENPAGSYLFKYAPICRLIGQLFNFCQCAYGLVLPGAQQHHYCRKNTSILSNLPELVILQLSCPGISATHVHDVAWGSRKLDGRTVSLARSAGAYPPNLCMAWAQAVAAAWKRFSC